MEQEGAERRRKTGWVEGLSICVELMFGPRGFAGWHSGADRLKESALSALALARGVCPVPRGRVKGTAGSGRGRDRMRNPLP